MEKLVKIQSELKAPKNQRNNFGKYNYRSCEDILEAVKPLLEKHNCILTITDEIKEVGNLVFVEATAIISDTETVKCITVKAQAGINPDRKGMDIAQSFGSSSSYARKYALNGLFLIDDTKDADTQDNSEKAPKTTPKVKPTLKRGSEMWDKAEAKIISNETTIEKIEGVYKLDEQDKAYLNKLKKK